VTRFAGDRDGRYLVQFLTHQVTGDVGGVNSDV
jgi:hypothetical protein